MGLGVRIRRVSVVPAAHSGEMLVLVSLGGICCFRGFFLGEGSILGGAGGAGCSSPDRAGREEVAEMVEDPLESGLGGDEGEVRMAEPLTGVTASLSGS